MRLVKMIFRTVHGVVLLRTRSCHVIVWLMLFQVSQKSLRKRKGQRSRAH
jgi:hypothetical protein